MHNGFSLFFLVLGMSCILEALPWLAAPVKMRRLAMGLAIMPDAYMRKFSLFIFAASLALTWIGWELDKDVLPFDFDFAKLFMVLGLVFILESLPWLLAPDRARLSYQLLVGIPPKNLQIGCAFILGLGLLLLWLGK